MLRQQASLVEGVSTRWSAVWTSPRQHVTTRQNRNWSPPPHIAPHGEAVAGAPHISCAVDAMRRPHRLVRAVLPRHTRERHVASPACFSRPCQNISSARRRLVHPPAPHCRTVSRHPTVGHCRKCFSSFEYVSHQRACVVRGLCKRTDPSTPPRPIYKLGQHLHVFRTVYIHTSKS